jgi:hypothetical protein
MGAFQFWGRVRLSRTHFDCALSAGFDTPVKRFGLLRMLVYSRLDISPPKLKRTPMFLLGDIHEKFVLC